MTALMKPADAPNGIFSLRFFKAAAGTANYSDNQFLFTYPSNDTYTAEAPTVTPATDGVKLGPFTITLFHQKLTDDAITVHWKEATVAKSATITGTATIGGTNAANLASASLDRNAGVLTLTFAVAHAPDAASITVDYKLRTTQGWSKAIRVTAAGATVNISFDGVNDHGQIAAGATAEYWDRYEGCIYIKGAASTFVVEAW